MNRRGFIGKLLALLGIGVVAPKVWGDKPNMTAAEFRAKWSGREIVKTPLDPSATRRYLVPTAEVPAFVKKVLGGFDPHGEPNAFTRTYTPVMKQDGSGTFCTIVGENRPVGYFDHCPLRHPEYPWMFATKVMGIEHCDSTHINGPWESIVSVTFAPLPFSVDCLPPYPEA